MTDLIFVTGNHEKFAVARSAFAEHGITLTQAEHDIDEIQGEDAAKIVADKLAKAYAAVNSPVVVNDDSWAIPGLNGFPGPYMKSINHWLSAEDLLRLTQPLADRTIILSQWFGYRDETGQELIHIDHVGELLPEIRGTYGNSLQKLITMPGRNGLSISEAYDQGIDISKSETSIGWRKFTDWYVGAQAAQPGKIS